MVICVMYIYLPLPAMHYGNLCDVYLFNLYLQCIMVICVMYIYLPLPAMHYGNLCDVYLLTFTCNALW